MSFREAANHQAGHASKGTDLDAMIGRRIRLRRVLLGMSQARLASQLSVSQQQVALFESGEGRLFASHLYLLGRVLGVPVGFFFGQEEPQPLAAVSKAAARNILPVTSLPASRDTDTESDPNREVREWAQAFLRIPPGESRSRLLKLVKRLSSKSNTND